MPEILTSDGPKWTGPVTRGKGVFWRRGVVSTLLFKGRIELPSPLIGCPHLLFPTPPWIQNACCPFWATIHLPAHTQGYSTRPKQPKLKRHLLSPVFRQVQMCIRFQGPEVTKCSCNRNPQPWRQADWKTNDKSSINSSPKWGKRQRWEGVLTSLGKGKGPRKCLQEKMTSEVGSKGGWGVLQGLNTARKGPYRWREAGGASGAPELCRGGESRGTRSPQRSPGQGWVSARCRGSCDFPGRKCGTPTKCWWIWAVGDGLEGSLGNAVDMLMCSRAEKARGQLSSSKSLDSGMRCCNSQEGCILIGIRPIS